MGTVEGEHINQGVDWLAIVVMCGQSCLCICFYHRRNMNTGSIDECLSPSVLPAACSSCWGLGIMVAQAQMACRCSVGTLQ